MSNLMESYRKLYSEMPSGTALRYISRAGEVLFKSYDARSGSSVVVRDGQDLTISADKIKEVALKLGDGTPLHLDTFLGAGGNSRTVIETLIAHLPEVAHLKIDNKKHLQAFAYEIHPPGYTLSLASDEWQSSEWAMAALLYEWNESPDGSEHKKAALARHLAKSTRRSAESWTARLENLRAARSGGGFHGGAETTKRSAHWLARLESEPKQVKELALRAFSPDADASTIAIIRREFGLPLTEEQPRFPVSDLLRALAAKPFAIVTGTSGTGKTREAENLAAAFRNADDIRLATNVALVAVGADWTDNRNVVGFVNHMRTIGIHGSDRPAFQATPVVDLLIAAEANPTVPHFLILDEMNLSHVERYFSDFLSAMESRNGTLHLHSEGPLDETGYRLARFEGDSIGVPRSIRYPANLFVIGTVNVDETTYMFSPKVLDRAHVLEFVMQEDGLRTFLAAPLRPPLPPRVDNASSMRFMSLSCASRDVADPLPPPLASTVGALLMDLFVLLKAGRFEFGYRSTSEVLAYLIACRATSASPDEWDAGDWRIDFDKAVIQKLLPRIHGSRVRIGGLVAALATYCQTLDLDAARAYLPQPGAAVAQKSLVDLLATDGDDARMTLSTAKLRQMALVLHQEQFASFIC